MGDPKGVGPEVVLKSLEQRDLQSPMVVVGNKDFFPGLRLIRSIDDLPLSMQNSRDPAGIFLYHVDDPVSTDPSYLYVKTAVHWALEKKIGAIVTAPVSKEKWLNSGVPFKGHTGMLAQTAGVAEHCMFFWSDNTKTALFTVHIPLKEVFQHIKKDKILRFIRFTVGELERLFKKPFTVLVAGLNPHAGENGFLGREETDEIIPAIQELKREMNIEGPFPPDIVFIKARETTDSFVVSWYHDQGLIAFKLLNIHSGVNMTLGLPYIRTSPDHGTAYDIAGKGIANPSSMIEALKLAEQLVRR